MLGIFSSVFRVATRTEKPDWEAHRLAHERRKAEELRRRKADYLHQFGSRVHF